MVDQMQEIGILVDCSHSSNQTTLDIIKRAKRPVVFSHSNPIALNHNIRNISDDQIKGIADTGGLIGVNAVNAYLKWNTKDAPKAITGPFPRLATLSQYVDVMDYIRRLVGVDYIGLGTDFTYGNPPDYASTHFPNPPSFVLPPTMLYCRNRRVRPKFQRSKRPPAPPRGTGAPRLLSRRHRENLGRQLDARVPRSLERLRF